MLHAAKYADKDGRISGENPAVVTQDRRCLTDYHDSCNQSKVKVGAVM